MRGDYIKPSELLEQQKKTGKSYWDLIGRPLYEEPENNSQPANDQSKYALALLLIEALSDYDYPQYKKGKSSLSYTYKPTGKYARIQEYIHALENPNNMGFDGKVWRPVRMKGYDPYGINGLDIRYEHNPDVYNYLKSKGRLNDPYLTVDEEQMLLNKAISNVVSDTQRLLKKWGVKNYTDDDFTKAVGMRYHGTLRKDTVAPYVKDGVWDSEGSFNYGERKFTTRRNAHNKYWELFLKTQPVVVPQEEVPQVSETLQRALSGYQFPESLIFLLDQRIAPPVGREPVTPYYLRPHQDDIFNQLIESVKSKTPNPMETFLNIFGYNRGKSFPFNFWNRGYNVIWPTVRYEIGKDDENPYVDYRSDTTRRGFHEGPVYYGANYLSPIGAVRQTLDTYLKDHNPYLITGVAPSPAFKAGGATKLLQLSLAEKVGMQLGIKNAFNKLAKENPLGDVYLSKVVTNAANVAGKPVSPVNFKNAQGKRVTTRGSVTTDDIFNNSGNAVRVQRTIQQPQVKRTPAKRLANLNYANDFIKKNKLSTMMGANGKVYVKMQNGTVRSLESLNKQIMESYGIW